MTNEGLFALAYEMVRASTALSGLQAAGYAEAVRDAIVAFYGADFVESATAEEAAALVGKVIKA